MIAREIVAKSALHRHIHAFKTHYDINPYRGCGHGCIYCFAQYSHKYLDSDYFFDDVIVKTNIDQALESDFSKRSWQTCPVNLSGVTDPYQPLEAKYQLMPKIIKVFIKYKNPMIITTKSTLLLRDLDLLLELNSVAKVFIRVSISAIDQIVAEKIEPFASPTQSRFSMIEELSKRKIHCEILMMPIIPFLTDNIENLDAIFKISKENGAENIFSELLNLRGNTKLAFFEKITNLFPEVASKILPLYMSAYVDKNYADAFKQKIAMLRIKHNFYNKICDFKQTNEAQLTLL